MSEKAVKEPEDRGDDFSPEEIKPLEIELDGEGLEDVKGVEPVEKKESADEAEEVDETDDHASGSIPKPRFDAVNTKAKTLEEENAKLREQLAAREAVKEVEKVDDAPEAPAEGSIEALRLKLKEVRKQSREALLDGELELTDTLTDEADTLVEQIAEAKAREVSTKSKVETETAAALNKVAADAFKLYPFLDVNSPSVDHDAVSIVIARRNALIETGLSQADALQQAVDEKGPRFAALNGIDVNESDAGKKVREAREAAARKKNAEASIKQPGMPESHKKETTFKININDLSDADFNKMSESNKARLRGDIV